MQVTYRFSAIAHPEGVEITSMYECPANTPINLESLNPLLRDFLWLKPNTSIASRVTLEAIKDRLKEDGFYEFTFEIYDEIISTRIEELVIWKRTKNDWCIGFEKRDRKGFSLCPVITQLPSLETAIEFAGHLRKTTFGEYEYYGHPEDEKPVTDPYGILEWIVGDGEDFICFDYEVLSGQQIVIDAVVNSETGSFIENFEYHIVPFSEAVDTAKEVVLNAKEWCSMNDVSAEGSNGEDFIERIMAAIKANSSLNQVAPIHLV